MKLANAHVALHQLQRGEGEPVVLLHGGMGDWQSWEPQVCVLARHFRVIAFSRRHSYPNEIPADTGYDVADDVEDLAALLEALHTGPCHLAGTSYGALVALAFALARPAQVRSLALCEPPLHAWARRTTVGRELYAAFLADTWIPARLAFDADRDREAIAILRDGMWGTSASAARALVRPETALRNARAMHALTRATDPFPDLPREAVAKLPVPVLLLKGQYASPLHSLVIDELAATLPRARRATITGAGHGAPAENPRAFNAALLSFLRAARHRNKAPAGIPP